MKVLTYLIVIAALVGVFNIFMPWIEYPQINKILKGSDGDGILISALFIIILGFQFIPFDVLKLVLTSVFSIGILWMAISKINRFIDEVENFTTNDPLVGLAGAGATLRYGLYVIAGTAAAILILSLIKYFTSPKNLSHV